jgi:protoporphyrinogen oxidase
MKRTHTPIAILGAGLTGMSAAHHLREAGVPFRIFERNSEAGGHATTYEDGAYRFDKTGHLLHLRDPKMRELTLRWIGNDWVEVKRNSVVWSHGVYTRYPYQANTYGLPPQIAYECLMGFIAAQKITDAPEPKNFEEFCLRHFGEGIARHFMIPYNARLWGVHPSEITTAWCQRFVPQPKLEDVVAGAVGMNDRELGYNTSFVYPRLGIGELPKGMARDLPMIEYGMGPKKIDLKAKELHFTRPDGTEEVVTYDALISTAPMKVLAEISTGIPAEVEEAASKLRCNPLWYLDVATKTPSGTPHHWVYVPEEKYPFYRLGCYSHFSSAMAPENGACFYVELADRNEPDLDVIVPQVAAGMVEMGILKSAEDIAFVRKRKIEHAYVLYDHAYVPSLEVLTPFWQQNKVVSAGRYGAWNYSSMEDALIFGRDAAALARTYAAL